jgi:hypothetical protein
MSSASGHPDLTTRHGTLQCHAGYSSNFNSRNVTTSSISNCNNKNIYIVHSPGASLSLARSYVLLIHSIGRTTKRGHSTVCPKLASKRFKSIRRSKVLEAETKGDVDYSSDYEAETASDATPLVKHAPGTTISEDIPQHQSSPVPIAPLTFRRSRQSMMAEHSDQLHQYRTSRYVVFGRKRRRRIPKGKDWLCEERRRRERNNTFYLLLFLSFCFLFSLIFLFTLFFLFFHATLGPRIALDSVSA